MRRSLNGLWLSPAIVVLAVGILTLSPVPVGVLHDDAIYVILAKSLATGHGYSYLNLPGEPSATHFPPGYPAFLALLWKLAPAFPGNVFVFKAANAVLLAIASVALAWFLHRRFSIQKGPAGMLAALAVLGLPSLLLSGLVLSEPLFLVLVLAGLLLAEECARGESRPRVFELVGLGLLAGVATLVRSAGIALLGAAVVRLAMQRRYRDAGITGIAALALLVPWQLWVSHHAADVPTALQGAYGPYTDWVIQAIRRDGLGLVLRTIGETTSQVGTFLLDTVSPFQSDVVRLLAGIILATLTFAGARRMWDAAPVTLLFLAFYAALVLVWPVPPARYVWGIWPLLLLIPALGVVRLAGWRPAFAPAQRLRLGLLGASAFIVVGYAMYNLTGYTRRQWLNIPMSAGALLRPIVLSVRAGVDTSETVAVSAEAAAYLYSGRASVPIYSYEIDHFFRQPTVDEEARAIDAITAAYDVDVIVASTDLQRRAVRAMHRPNNSAFTLRDSTPTALIFGRKSN